MVNDDDVPFFYYYHHFFLDSNGIHISNKMLLLLSFCLFPQKNVEIFRWKQ